MLPLSSRTRLSCQSSTPGLAFSLRTGDFCAAPRGVLAPRNSGQANREIHQEITNRAFRIAFIDVPLSVGQTSSGDHLIATCRLQPCAGAIRDRRSRTGHPKGLRRNKFPFWRERRAGRREAAQRRRCRCTSSRSANEAGAGPARSRPEGLANLKYEMGY